MSHDEYSYSFLLWPKIMTATSTEQRTASSCAFLNRPPFRFKNVTERLRSSLMALISIFLRPMMDNYGRINCAPIAILRIKGIGSRGATCEISRAIMI